TALDITPNQIQTIMEAYPRDERFALAILQDMQRTFQYIPRIGLMALAEYLGRPEASLYSMATFYKALSLKPKCKHIIKCCDGTACHIRGSFTIVDGVKRLLGLAPGETSEDGLFSLETVNCMGACTLAPVVDDVYHSKVTLDKLKAILEECAEEDKA
ncbi:NADH-quinone oxidoreductase subunit NuoE family protein, partial [Eubacterium aggregans]|uniref:NADH-quinone oxidoreductase subunit NuoE family protein n=1 Tax=Eubacterium aggregans TaxID=81409 RepID=UPI003F2CD636